MWTHANTLTHTDTEMSWLMIRSLQPKSTPKMFSSSVYRDLSARSWGKDVTVHCLQWYPSSCIYLLVVLQQTLQPITFLENYRTEEKACEARQSNYWLTISYVIWYLRRLWDFKNIFNKGTAVQHLLLYWLWPCRRNGTSTMAIDLPKSL